ncbi:MAG: hypothetical protein CO032_04900 [Nitrosopumilales archaeon CG_4_9_14_0_2_um_filter_34_16]|nr:MAG: hypothetical protein CO032_04900 [Nitrosopumilales archaeon CG_4_9_14_0_2_um_filter_34_16]
MRKESKDSEKEIDFGERKISKMNFSHIVTIPKRFIQSTRYEKITSVRVIMQDGYLKLVPIRAKNGDEEVEL